MKRARYEYRAVQVAKNVRSAVGSYLPDCERCGHPADWHRLDDSLNLDPTDPAAPFRCIGYDCTIDAPYRGANRSGVERDCDCPNYVMPDGKAVG